MTIGETIFPRIIPNLNQSLFRGVKIDEFNKPRIKNIKQSTSDHILRSPSLNNGYIETIRKTKKKTIPKLLLELVLMFFIFNIKLTKVVSSYPLC
jgi:hypothetical protein